METATLSTNGQLVIPMRLRKALNLRPGDTVAVSIEGRRLVIEPRSDVRASLVRGRSGRPVLVAQRGAWTMKTITVNAILDELS